MDKGAASQVAKSAQTAAKEAGNILSSKLDDVRGEAGTAVRRRSKQIQSSSRRASRAITALASQARDVASNASDTIVTYTKKNPAKALALAAASGALLFAAIRALSPPRR